MSRPSETPPPPMPPPTPQQPPAGRKFPCRQCGARLDFDPKERGLKCPYCGFVEKIEPKSDEVKENSWDEYWSKQQDAENATLEGHSTEVRCTGCGAVVLFDDKLVTDSCPYCNTHLENKPERARGMIKPEAILPFLVTKSQAVENFGKWIETRWFAPGTLRKFALLGRLSGMYVPFWTYDSMTYTYYEGERGDNYTVTETYTDSDGQTKTRSVVKTRWTWVSGEVDHFFDDVLVCASRSLPAKLVNELEPWDLVKLENYQAQYLSGFVTERYAVDLKEGFGAAQEIMDGHIRSMCCQDIGGDHQRLSSVQTQHVGVTFKHLLLPVWVAPYRFKDTPYQILVNARTGEVVGSRPFSWIKITLLIIIIAALIALIYVAANASWGAEPARRPVDRRTGFNQRDDGPTRRARKVSRRQDLCAAVVHPAHVDMRVGQVANLPRPDPWQVINLPHFPRLARERGEENEVIHEKAGTSPDAGRHGVAGRRPGLSARAAA
ncbi:MAG: hypothetical protein AB7K24_01675 [Gemmataceae bacterium]